MYTDMKKGPEGPLLFFWLKYVVPDVLPPMHHYRDEHHTLEARAVVVTSRSVIMSTGHNMIAYLAYSAGSKDEIIPELASMTVSTAPMMAVQYVFDFRRTIIAFMIILSVIVYLFAGPDVSIGYELVVG